MGIASIRRAIWAFPLVLACGGGSSPASADPPPAPPELRGPFATNERGVAPGG